MENRETMAYSECDACPKCGKESDMMSYWFRVDVSSLGPRWCCWNCDAPLPSIAKLHKAEAFLHKFKGDTPDWEVIDTLFDDLDSLRAELAEARARADKVDEWHSETMNALADLAKGELPKCSHCENRATCCGRYEGHGPAGFGCNTCCGHGNEDGWCVFLSDTDAELAAAKVDIDEGVPNCGWGS